MAKGDTPRGGKVDGVAAVLRRSLKGAGLEARLPELDLKRRWPDIVGPDLSRFTHPQSLKGGELTILVPSGVWAQEILGLQQEILTRIREKLPQAGAPRRLQVRIGRLPEQPAPSYEPPPLLDEDRLTLETRGKLAKVKDPEVREALSRFVRRYVGKGR